MKIYTRTGDGGETALFDGTRVPKSDSRVDAYGEIDELNAVIGVACAAGSDVAFRTVSPDIYDVLVQLQRDLFALGARLADPAHRIAGRVSKATLGAADVTRLENWIDEFDGELQPLRHFILPGGGMPGAMLHLARTVCRRAERRMVGLGRDAVDPILITYVNRLSDLLFVLARVVNKRAGISETPW